MVESDTLGSFLRKQLEPGEVVNTITHGIGLLLSMVGGVLMIASASFHGDVWRILGTTVFVVSLVGVYGASTLSHFFSEPKLRTRFRTLDQAFIYLLIVGTYTPFSLVFLRSGLWWVFLGVMWTIALVGFFSKILFAHRIEGVGVWSYVLLGWLPVLPAGAMIGLVPAPALWWMLIGGLSYTVGTVFLVWDLERFHFHGIWHALVIAGSTCHFFAIFFVIA